MADKRTKTGESRVADPKTIELKPADPLAKADALMGRHRVRGKGPATQPPTQPMLDLELPEEFPVLTEVVTALPPAAPDAAALEAKIRSGLIESLRGELESAIAARVHESIGPHVEEILRLAARELEAEIRDAARTAVTEAIAAEFDRLKVGGAGPEKGK